MPFSEEEYKKIFEAYFRMRNEYLTEDELEDDFYYSAWMPFFFEYVKYNRERIRKSMDKERDYSSNYEEFCNCVEEEYPDMAIYLAIPDEGNFAAYLLYLMETESDRYNEINIKKKQLENCYSETDFESLKYFLECFAVKQKTFYFDGQSEEQVSEEEYNEMFEGGFNHWHEIIMCPENPESEKGYQIMIIVILTTCFSQEIM